MYARTVFSDMYGLREPFIYMYFLKYNYQNGELKKWRSYDIKWSLHRLPWWLSGEESVCECRRHRFDPWVRKIPQRRKWQLTPVFLPGKCHGQGSLAGYDPQGHKRIKHDLVTKQQLSNIILNWSKISFHNILWKIPNETFGQSSTF